MAASPCAEIEHIEFERAVSSKGASERRKMRLAYTILSPLSPPQQSHTKLRLLIIATDGECSRPITSPVRFSPRERVRPKAQCSSNPPSNVRQVSEMTTATDRGREAPAEQERIRAEATKSFQGRDEKGLSVEVHVDFGCGTRQPGSSRIKLLARSSFGQMWPARSLASGVLSAGPRRRPASAALHG